MQRLMQFGFYVVAGFAQAVLILLNDTFGGEARPWHPSSTALVGLLGSVLILVVGAGASLYYEKPALAVVTGGALCLVWSLARGFEWASLLTELRALSGCGVALGSNCPLVHPCRFDSLARHCSL